MDYGADAPPPVNWSLELQENHMRNFKNVTKTKQQELDKLFPEILTLYDNENTSAYNKGAVCVFDHWLSKKEAIKSIDNISNEKKQSHNQKLHSFCIDLVKSTECYLVKLLGRKKDQVTYKEFTSEAGFTKKLTPNHHLSGDKYRFVLVLPKLEAVYFEGSDFTHHVYYKNVENLQTISNLATDNGLYLIK